ncbi:MAG: hypothetical protein ABJ363_13765 [Alphaproteobacteria bacterium]
MADREPLKDLYDGDLKHGDGRDFDAHDGDIRDGELWIGDERKTVHREESTASKQAAITTNSNVRPTADATNANLHTGTVAQEPGTAESGAHAPVQDEQSGSADEAVLDDEALPGRGAATAPPSKPNAPPSSETAARALSADPDGEPAPPVPDAVPATEPDTSRPPTRMTAEEPQNTSVAPAPNIFAGSAEPATPATEPPFDPGPGPISEPPDETASTPSLRIGSASVSAVGFSPGNGTGTGTAGDDVLQGGAGDDSIDGGDGNDTLYGDNNPASLLNASLNISASLTDTDGSETLSILIEGVPVGAALSAGTDNGDGSWTLSEAQLAKLTIAVPQGTADFDLTLTATATESNGGDTASSSTTISVVVDPGRDGDDTIVGGTGNDTIYGQGGDDTISGGAGADTIDAGSGDDIIHASGGGDTIDGGAGSDTINYSAAASGGSVNLSTGTDSTGATISNIENLVGSNSGDTLVGNGEANVLSGGGGNDTLSGGAGNDRLRGGDGNDILAGGEGADTLNGGAGIDTVVYADATSGVTASLGGVGNIDIANLNDEADGDQITNVENLIGSGHNDSLTGNSDANLIRGGGGNDSIMGGAGNDTLVGGSGNDTVSGGSGNDTISGGDGNDTLRGNTGDDVLSGNAGDDLFLYSSGDGDTAVHGGAGWTDTLRIDAPSAGGTNWTIAFDGGSSVNSVKDGYADLTADASGTITYSDGSVITFDGLEKIEW